MHGRKTREKAKSLLFYRGLFFEIFAWAQIFKCLWVKKKKNEARNGKFDLFQNMFLQCVALPCSFKNILAHIRYLKASIITEALSGFIFKYLGF